MTTDEMSAARDASVDSPASCTDDITSKLCSDLDKLKGKKLQNMSQL